MGVNIEIGSTNNFAAAGAKVLDDAQDGVTLGAMRLLAITAERAPLDLGTLVGSGSVSSPMSAKGGDPVAELVYDTPYAAKLHEHPEFNFQNGRQGKYVEEPALEHRDEIGAIIARRMSSD